jgi:hypothetical protein
MFVRKTCLRLGPIRLLPEPEVSVQRHRFRRLLQASEEELPEAPEIRLHRELRAVLARRLRQELLVEWEVLLVVRPFFGFRLIVLLSSRSGFQLSRIME